MITLLVIQGFLQKTVKHAGNVLHQSSTNKLVYTLSLTFDL